MLDINKEIERLRVTGNFDPDWYARHYGDVPKGIDPAEHYLRIGRKLGRLAGAGVSRRDLASPKEVLDRKLPLNVLVLSWDVGHNPIGRAYMLADAISRVVRHCTIAGFQFPRYGRSVWEPLKNSSIPIVRADGKNIPEIFQSIERIALASNPDIVVACKPRLPSLLAGMRIREVAGCPLVVDIDDHELSFFKDPTPLSLQEIERLERGAASSELEPFEERWTRLCETLLHDADLKLVSNTNLKRRFGGTLLPHVRDEKAFSTQFILAARPEARQRLNLLDGDRVVMFFGTPRIHKGLGELAKAIGEMADPKVKLVVIGTAPDRSVTAKLEGLSKGRLIMVPNQPFDQVPALVSAADVIALPQDPSHPVSEYQLPAKAIDAIAAGVPLIVTETPPIRDLIRDGVARPFAPGDLKSALQSALSAEGQSEIEAQATRKTYLDKYSYTAASNVLRREFASLVRRKSPVDSQRGRRVIEAVSSACDVRPPEADGGAAAELVTGLKDVVVFWKQNDTTLYGRRHDMVIKHLASRPDVRQVVVFDAPISEFDLEKLRSGETLTQSRFIYETIEAKRYGFLDTEKIRYRTFVHPAGIYNLPGRTDPGRKPLAPAFADWVKAELGALNIDSTKSTFLLYPKNFCLPEVLDRLKPRRILVDVVDDHRAWPNVPQPEKDRLTAHYRHLLGRADFAMANCQPVIDSMKGFFPKIKLIPNGCDPAPEFEEPLHDPLYLKVRNFPGKVIGYVGNLEPKIDIELLEHTSRAFPDALLVLVGSTHAFPEVRRLAELPNVVMPGVAPYKHANAWIRRFHVALIPHRMMSLTQNMNPIKQYVYAAHGIPIVATKIPNLAPDLVRVTSSSEEFVQAISEMLSRPNKANEIVDDAVRANSWAQRLKGVKC